jgi:hypothetical protein
LCSNESAFGLVLVVLVQEVVKPRERVELGFIVGVGVDLQRDGQARMAEDDLRVTCRDAEWLRGAVECVLAAASHWPPVQHSSANEFVEEDHRSRVVLKGPLPGPLPRSNCSLTFRLQVMLDDF